MHAIVYHVKWCFKSTYDEFEIYILTSKDNPGGWHPLLGG